MSGIVVIYSIYAVVLFVGGATGYAKAKSLPSLIAGVVSGVLATAAAILLHLQHPRAGLGLGVVLSLAMAGFFFGRFRRTQKAMPAFPIIALSALILVLSLARLFAAPSHHA